MDSFEKGEDLRRGQEQLECEQTWNLVFILSVVLAVVFGILLILYCIMYRKHIKFLLIGPPPEIVSFTPSIGQISSRFNVST
ncbi:unnamed protein product [Anisakis simplex]|uniref:Transmembrane protein n=1 Tax=Anisakis simplex TaxID=6269 RepID=A0A0M3KIP1_ANISI|nr:unnamed protein product [Anisakis simplex]